MTLADTLAPLRDRYLALADQKARIEEQLDEIKTAIRDLVDGPDAYQAGEGTITVSVNRRFDPKAAERLLAPEVLDMCRISKIDSAAAKAVLPPALYEQCMTTAGQDRITVK